ncbi:MAG TPA: hypothetical protein VGM65_14805, partial [Candidatus Udaeobacter sp.]
ADTAVSTNSKASSNARAETVEIFAHAKIFSDRRSECSHGTLSPCPLINASAERGGYSKIGLQSVIQTLPEYFSTTSPFWFREAGRRGDLGADGGIVNRFSGPL